MSRRSKLRAWVVALVAALAVVVGSVSAAFAAAGGTPPHTKNLTNNQDGTYTISLDIVGESEKKPNNVNVIVIMDTSGSMNTQRMSAAKNAVNSLANSLYAYNTTENPDTVEMALVRFATSSSVARTPTSNRTQFANAVSGLPNQGNGGTNWEAALQTANGVSFGDEDQTFVVFVSDGNPTFRTSQNGWNDWSYQYQQYGTGQETTTNIQRCYTTAVDDAQALATKVTPANFFTIGAFGNVDRMEQLTDDAGSNSSTNYYSAQNTAALNQAIADILAKIEMAGFADAEIDDGTTNQVTTSSGDVAELLELVPNFQYYRSGGDYGTMQPWTDAPEAKVVNGEVVWDLESEGVLENGVRYTVTFDCYPSQTTYDYIAQLKNGDIKYSDLDPEIQKYIVDNGGGSYSLRTNTNAQIQWDDTRDDAGRQQSGYTNPDPVATDAETLVVSKEWEGGDPDVDSVDMTVLMDDEKFHIATLSESNGWEDESFISIGIIKNGQVLPGAEGHDFTFAELDGSQYHWELDTPTVHPMLINGTKTMLIKVDAKHPAPSGAQTYTIKGATYYVDTEAAGLTAINHRRSNLNLTKVVTGDSAPDGAKFPFQLTVNNSKAPDAEPTDDPNHDSDYWVWLSVRDENNQGVTGLSMGGGVVESGNGYYYAPSGTTFSLEIEDGWNLRFTNLPSDTTYTFVEGTLPDGFAFSSSELTAGEDSTFKGGQTTTGTIENTKTSYAVTYTNDYQLTEFDVTKVWDDGNNQDGLRPTSEAFKNNLALEPTPEPEGWVDYPAPDDVEEIDSNTFKYTWHNLPRYADGGEITYVVKEYAEDVPNGYTCAQQDQPVRNHGQITNVHTPEVTETTVEKVWEDDDDADGVRPESIQVRLFKKVGEAAKQLIDTYTLEPDENGNWTLTVNNLAKYEGGTEITYIWEEVESQLEGIYSLTKTAVEGNTTTFTNSRVTIDTETDVVLNKTVEAEGTAWAPKTFEFEIKPVDGAPAPESATGTATFNAAGTQPIDFGKISFTKEGTYKYTVKETTTSGNGWTCDNTEHDVEVTVSVDDNGKLTAEVTKVAEITNTYSATGSVVLEATKAIEGADWPEGETITFTLAGQGGTLPETKTVELTKPGKATFGAINYTMADAGKTYTYTISEDGFGDGWTGSGDVTATVKVTDNGDGTLKTEVTYSPDNATITNTYEAEGTAVLKATKAIEGANWPEGKTITFTLAGQGGTLPESKTVTLSAAGEATFGAITYDESDAGKTYTYTITEDGFGTGWTGSPEEITATVKVTDEGDGTLSTEITYDPEDATFTNTYKAEGEAVLEATKAISGAEWPAGKSITFTLAGQGGTLPETKTVELTEEGKATFGAIKYTEADIDQTYTYTITEDGFGAGWTGSPEEITATVKVTDNGDGTLSTDITYSPEDATITNTYAASGSAEIEVTKELTGRDWLDGETFTFTLSGADGEIESIDVSEDNPTAKFAPIDYNQEDMGKTFTYTVSETGTLPGGIKKSGDVTVTVKVTDNGDGTLKTDISYQDDNDTITNTYEAEGDVTLEAFKELEGREWQEGEIYTFTLKDADGNVIDEQEVSSNSKVTFDTIEYTEADMVDDEGNYTPEVTFTYTIEETSELPGGVTNSGTITATVTVTDNGDGTLSTAVEYTNDDTITNTYEAEGTAVLEATKAIEGAAWPADKTITFTLAGQGGTLPETKTVILSAPGKATFGAITYDESDAGKTYTYTITEDGFGDGWTGSGNITATVEVIDNGDGSLSTKISYDPENKTITNKYEAEGEAVLEANKVLTGREWQDGESFTFTLIGPDGNTIEEKSVTANGPVTFSAISYDESDAGKTYKYTISETGTLPGGVTKTGDITATVEVTDNGDGTLATDVTYSPEDATITNTYKPENVKAHIDVTKNIDGYISGEDKYGNVVDRTFNITMKGPKIDGQLEASITTSGGTGTASFDEIEYTFDDMKDDEGNRVTKKEFTYEVTETAGSDAGFDYDKNTYKVIVTVEDDLEGHLVVKDITKLGEETNVDITNVFKQTGVEVVLTAYKEIDDQSLSAQDATFTFDLKDSNGETLQTKEITTTDLKGSVDFDALKFTEAGTYNYTIVENGTAPDGWTYDTVERKVTIVVNDNFETAILEEETTINGNSTTEVTFTNVYQAEATEATLEVTKEVEDKSGSADDVTFEFTLAKVGDAPMPETVTATAKAGETATFGPITYETVGEFNYTITETKGGNTSAGWTNDTTTYPVKVTVVDDSAHLVASVVYGESDTELSVTNTYDPKDATATPQARKVVDDQSDSAPDEEFTFNLLDSEGSVVETKTIKNGGLVKFSELTFDKVGTYNYTIQEVAGSTKGFTYDTAPHAVTITVTDPGTGQLEASIEYADATDGELVITNPYCADPTSIVVEVNKQIEGATPDKDATFTFNLSGEGQDMTTSVKGAGTASFDEIKYTKAGTYYYTVTELDGGNDSYIYDDTVFTVKVDVVDEDGTLVATPTYTAGNEDADEITFVNTFRPEVGLKVTKEVTSKPANGKYYKEGETITYEIVVTNTGKIALTDVKVDDELTGDHWTVETLAAGASETFTTSYKVTKADVKAGSVLNEVTAEADNPVDPDKPLKDKDKVKVPTGDEKNPPHKKVVPQTGDETPTGAMAVMTVFGAAALTAGTVLQRRKRK